MKLWMLEEAAAAVQVVVVVVGKAVELGELEGARKAEVAVIRVQVEVAKKAVEAKKGAKKALAIPRLSMVPEEYAKEIRPCSAVSASTSSCSAYSKALHSSQIPQHTSTVAKPVPDGFPTHRITNFCTRTVASC